VAKKIDKDSLGRRKRDVTRSKITGLTPLQEAVVRERLKNPTAKLETIAKLAGIEGDARKRKSTVHGILSKPAVKTALRHPPPSPEELQARAKELGEKLDLDDPVQARKYLKGWYQKIVEDPGTPQSERIRALNSISEMTPGAKVPVGVHHTGAWTLEKFVEAAGGKPADAPAKSIDLPN
jgi:hypothetical protein